MKGWKTIVFNALMLIGGLTGANLDPALVTGFAEEFVAVLAIGNGILRSITDTPVFKGKASRVGRHMQAVAIAVLCLLVVGCGARDTALEAIARGIDEACARGTSILAMEGRKQAVRDVNARTAIGNHTASDCDSDGEPDFDIDPNGIPLPAVP